MTRDELRDEAKRQGFTLVRTSRIIELTAAAELDPHVEDLVAGLMLETVLAQNLSVALQEERLVKPKPVAGEYRARIFVINHEETTS